jgi:DNA end-binding protein Ku
MRATCSGYIAFGLVSVPVKVYVATDSNAVAFNLFTPAGNRVKQHMTDAVTGEPVQQKDCNKGFEYEKDKFVIFDKDEIKALESSDTSKCMTIQEFVPADQIDSIQVEKTYFLGPDKGGDRGYKLLASTLARIGKVAIAQWTTRGKERLVLIRSYKNGLVLQELYYSDEVRDISEVEPAKVEVSAAEEELALRLVETLTVSTFDQSKYVDGYAQRVKTAVDQKVVGTTPLSAGPSPKENTVLDLMNALKASLEAK